MWIYDFKMWGMKRMFDMLQLCRLEQFEMDDQLVYNRKQIYVSNRDWSVKMFGESKC